MLARWRRLIPILGLVACEAGGSSDPGTSLPVAAILISPPVSLLQVGETFILSASPLDATGAVLGRSVVWSSSANATLSVTQGGEITGVAAGLATVTATSGGRATSVNVDVIPQVKRLAVSPTTSTIELGTNLQLTLAILDANDAPIVTTAPIAWSVSPPARATVSATGLLTPLQTGGVVVTARLTPATFSPVTATASVVISPPVVITSVEILPNPLGLIVGQTRTLLALARDGQGNAITGRTFAWTVNSPVFINVGAASGSVTAFLPGSTQVTATTSGVLGASTVRVFREAPSTGLGVGFGLDQYTALPGGTFTMGSDDGNQDERPVRTITLSPFKIQKTEVTRQQWISIMGTLPAGQTGCDLCPVSNVTWDQAQNFIAILNLANPGAGFRLPTEAQWEYAARAGTTTSSYADLQLIAEYGATADSHVWPVGLRDPNSFVLFDVLGNVSEWTLDWYATSYLANQTTDPVGPATGTKHVDRGGAYSTTSGGVRASYRAGASSLDLIGLRLVRN